jgi:hypothetical protein
MMSQLFSALVIFLIVLHFLPLPALDYSPPHHITGITGAHHHTRPPKLIFLVWLEVMTSHLLSRCSTTWATPPGLLLYLFGNRVLLFAQLSWTTVHLSYTLWWEVCATISSFFFIEMESHKLSISASQASRITGMNHWCLTLIFTKISHFRQS